MDFSKVRKLDVYICMSEYNDLWDLILNYFVGVFLETTFFSEVKAIKQFEGQLRTLIKFV